MEPGCNFTRGFVPTDAVPEALILLAHVRNCDDCQHESYLVLPATFSGA